MSCAERRPRRQAAAQHQWRRSFLHAFRPACTACTRCRRACARCARSPPPRSPAPRSRSATASAACSPPPAPLSCRTRRRKRTPPTTRAQRAIPRRHSFFFAECEAVHTCTPPATVLRTGLVRKGGCIGIIHTKHQLPFQEREVIVTQQRLALSSRSTG